ncbi:MAG: cytochrome c biogenesis protein DipZ, partial [Solirubrobacteraceae bacterium]
TYLNSGRGQNLAPPLQKGTHFYPGVNSPALNEFGLHGTWTVTAQGSTPASPGATITGRFQAARAYLVLTSAGNIPRQVRVLLDGHAISAAQAGSDVQAGTVTVRGQRLYGLVSLPAAGQHTLTLEVPSGVSAYSFTFG